MRRVAPVVVALAVAVACGRLGFEDVAGDGATAADGVPAADGLPACEPGANPYSFDGPNGCMPWGGSGAGVTFTSVDGRLVITPTPGVAAAGTCTAPQELAFASGLGGWVEVPAVLDPAVPTAFTRFDLADLTGGQVLRLVVTEGELRAHAGPAANPPMLVQSPWSPGASWWRWRPSGADSIAELSGDGRVWTPFATATGIAPAQARPSVAAGHGSGVPPAGSAAFEGFNECPP
jgi:hypothetical protein